VPNPSPVIAQWFAAKQQNPDALLFFRMGDFYELFFADAEAAAAALGIALTARGEHDGAPIPMCGVPIHAADAYLARLIRRGFRVAIAEQMEAASARSGKAPLRREVVRLVTPGTLTEDALLDGAHPNLLLALARAGATLGAAWLDISTGLFETADTVDLPALLGRLDPVEIVASSDIPLGDYNDRRAPDTAAPPPLAARARVAEAFAVASLDAFGAFSDAEAMAAALALAYVRATQAGKLPHLSAPAQHGTGGALAMDAATRASLEITRARDGGEHTLLASIQRTITAAGARTLAAWLSAPLTDPARITARQAAWSALTGSAVPLRVALRGAPDIARALARLSLGRGTPRDLGAIRTGVSAATEAAAALPADPALISYAGPLRLDPALHAQLAAALADDLPARSGDGPGNNNVILPGFDGELDAHRRLRDESRRVISGLQLDYAQRYGVAALKIRHHAQLGYVIEVPAAAAETLRAHPGLTLRQSMANAARFTNPDLADLDRRIAEAADRAAARENTILAALTATILQQAPALRAAAEALAALDALQSCAALAATGVWSRPIVTPDRAFAISAGRHPVVEAALARTARFIPNDCDLSPTRRVLLLTGPNMAGKSTFLRQNALIVILAQAGLPVPAAAARIGIVDRLFSRVGAADDLARGRSTFMVEMTETAAILNQAGPNSLVVVDEIGRGTATSDGLAIAWAVLEALHNQVRCRTIFATHFHELAGLTAAMPQMCPHTMRVREWKGDVVFLHEVGEGAAGRSWGVHVARLAGIPAPTVRRAAALLTAIERGAPSDLPLFTALPTSPPPLDRLRLALDATDPDKLSPREALDALYNLKTLGLSSE